MRSIFYAANRRGKESWLVNIFFELFSLVRGYKFNKNYRQSTRKGCNKTVVYNSIPTVLKKEDPSGPNVVNQNTSAAVLIKIGSELIPVNNLFGFISYFNFLMICPITIFLVSFFCLTSINDLSHYSFNFLSTSNINIFKIARVNSSINKWIKCVSKMSSILNIFDEKYVASFTRQSVLLVILASFIRESDLVRKAKFSLVSPAVPSWSIKEAGISCWGITLSRFSSLGPLLLRLFRSQ